MGAEMVRFTVRYRETDLWIAVDRGDPSAMSAAAQSFVTELRRELDDYLPHDPDYRHALAPYVPHPAAPLLLHEMAAAAATAGIGPMSAVAGAFARETGRMLRRRFGIGEVVVENGGDIYADVQRPLDVALFAGQSPLSERIGLHIPPPTASQRPLQTVFWTSPTCSRSSKRPATDPTSSEPSPSRTDRWPSAAHSNCGCSKPAPRISPTQSVIPPRPTLRNRRKECPARRFGSAAAAKTARPKFRQNPEGPKRR